MNYYTTEQALTGEWWRWQWNCTSNLSMHYCANHQWIVATTAAGASPSCEDDGEGWNGKCNHLTRLSDADADFHVVPVISQNIIVIDRWMLIPHNQRPAIRHHLMGFALRVHWDGKVCFVLFASPHIHLCAIYQELKLSRKWIGICTWDGTWRMKAHLFCCWRKGVRAAWKY